MGRRSPSDRGVRGVGLAAALLVVGLWAPRTAPAQPAERDAALVVFEEGKALFKDGRYQEALANFEKANDLVEAPAVRYYLGRTLAALGRCGEALPVLKAVAGQVPPRLSPLREADETQCMQAEATRLVKDGDCRSAMPLLQGLRGRLKAAAEVWRAQKAAYCAPRSKEFPTDTAAGKAAYGLFVAARAAVKKRDFKGAESLYVKAIGFADEPVIRRELARLQVGGGDYDSACKTLAGITASARSGEDRARGLHCGSLRPAEGRDRAWRLRYLDGILSAFRARGRGDLGAMVAELDGRVVRGGRNVATEALALEALFEAGRCADYARRAAKVEERLRDPGIDLRLRACAARGARKTGEEAALLERIAGGTDSPWLLMRVAGKREGSGAYGGAAEACRKVLGGADTPATLAAKAKEVLARMGDRVEKAWVLLPASVRGRPWVLDGAVQPRAKEREISVPVGPHLLGWSSAGGAVLRVRAIEARVGERVAVRSDLPRAQRVELRLDPPRAAASRLAIGSRSIAVPAGVRVLRLDFEHDGDARLTDAAGVRLARGRVRLVKGKALTWAWTTGSPPPGGAVEEGGGFPWTWVLVGAGVAVAGGIVAAVVLSKGDEAGAPPPDPAVEWTF